MSPGDGVSSAFGGRPVATTIRPPSRRRATSATIVGGTVRRSGVRLERRPRSPRRGGPSTRALSSAAALPTCTTTTLADVAPGRLAHDRERAVCDRAVEGEDHASHRAPTIKPWWRDSEYATAMLDRLGAGRDASKQGFTPPGRAPASPTSTRRSTACTGATTSSGSQTATTPRRSSTPSSARRDLRLCGARPARRRTAVAGLEAIDADRRGRARPPRPAPRRRAAVVPARPAQPARLRLARHDGRPLGRRRRPPLLRQLLPDAARGRARSPTGRSPRASGSSRCGGRSRT